MYCNDKLKLNKFRYVAIPKPREYFLRFNGMMPTGQAYTGDEPADMPMRKSDELARMHEIDMYNLYKESRANEVSE